MSTPSPTSSNRPGALAWTLALGGMALLATTFAITSTLTVSTYRYTEALLRGSTQEWQWALAHVAGMAIAAALCAGIAALWRVQPLRDHLWGLAGLAGLSAALGVGRVLEVHADGWRAALSVLAAALWWVLGAWLARKRTPAGRPGGLGLALSAVPLLIAPWLAFGALGSWNGLVMHIVVGLAIGGAVAQWLVDRVFTATAQAGYSGRRAALLNGFVAAIGLWLVGQGIGANALQLIIGPALAALGWAAAVIDGPARACGRDARPAVALVLAAVIAAALSTFDPEEQTLFLVEEAVGLWATSASLGSAGIAFGLGVVGVALDDARLNWTERARFAAPLGLVGLLVALGLYVGVGRPGFYGDRLFVVMRQQADLTAIDQGLEQKARAAAVYGALTQHAESTQADLRRLLDGFRVDYTPYYLVNALEVDGGPLLGLVLSLRPDVAAVMPSQRLRPAVNSAGVAAGSEPGPAAPEWNITSIGADRVWEELGVTGAGVVVGQSDSGVAGQHPALAAQYRGRETGDDYNWLDPWEGSRAPVDTGGHGTHTLGSILGAGGIGVAPGAEWYGCRNLARNLGNPALYLDCMQFMLAPYPQAGDAFADGDPARGAHVLNNSWGCPPIEGCRPDVLEPAAEALRVAGIFVVASAGNDGPRCSTIMDPIANYDAVFSVGATDSIGDLADFSSRGPVPGADGLSKPDIAAPGVDILSAMPDGNYGRMSGTSMAGPHVVGVVALMWSANPELIGDIETTERILRETTRPFTGRLVAEDCDVSQNPEWAIGAGLVDAYAAVVGAMAER